MKNQFVVAVLLLCLSAGWCQAASLVIDDHQTAVSLGPYTEFFRDETRVMDLGTVQSQGQFQPSTDINPNVGFTRDKIWLRFRLENPLDTQQIRILDVRYFLLDDAILHAPDAAGGYQTILNGRRYLEQRPPESGRFYSFQLTLPAHSSQLYYMEFSSADSVALPIMLSTPERQQQYQIRDTLFMTLYGGLILSTLFFALFMLASLRERVLLYYAGFLVSHHLFALMLMEGVPTALFGLNSLFMTREMDSMAIDFAILIAVLFMRNFLRLEQANPALYRFTHWMVGAMLVALVQAIILPHHVSVMLTAFICMIVGACILVCCGLQARDQMEARHFLMAWSAGILGATVYGLKIFTLVPVNLFTSYSWHMGTVLEAILFSYTIAQRVNTERRERLRTQTELADRERALRLTQEKLLHAETAAKEELETRVRERTRDITRILAELELENRNLLELSINDGLTRVRNRRFFNDYYPQIWQDALESGRWISVVMLDIDNFKSVNDTYGHLSGDRCLVAVAGVLKQMASRPGDMICRYGGEEFILVLADTDPDSARWVAERIRMKISETPIELETSTLHLTVSLGVSGMIPEPGLDPLRLVARGDEALYQSKQQGRNRVTLLGKPQANNLVPLNRKA